MQSKSECGDSMRGQAAQRLQSMRSVRIGDVDLTSLSSSLTVHPVHSVSGSDMQIVKGVMDESDENVRIALDNLTRTNSIDARPTIQIDGEETDLYVSSFFHKRETYQDHRIEYCVVLRNVASRRNPFRDGDNTDADTVAVSLLKFKEKGRSAFVSQEEHMENI